MCCTKRHGLQFCAFLFTSSLIQGASTKTWKLVIDQDAGADDAMAIFMAFIYEKYFEGTKTWKLVIDQDAGADDAMAIFMAFIYEKYFEGPEVVAVTVSHGNVNETQAFHNTQRILSIANRRDVPIYRGAAHSLIFEPASDHYFGQDGLGDTEYMSHFSPIAAQHERAAIGLIQLSKEYKGCLVIITLGALTNLALAARLDPGFIHRVKQIYIAAGHIQTDYFTKPEYNVLADVEAYKVLMEVAEPDKVTLIPYSEVQLDLELSWEFRLDVLGHIDTKIMKVQNEFDKVAFGKKTALRGQGNFQYLDPAAMAAVLNRSIVHDCKYSKSDVALCGASRGLTTTDFVEKAQANVNIFTSYYVDMYQQFLLQIFSLDL